MFCRLYIDSPFINKSISLLVLTNSLFKLSLSSLDREPKTKLMAGIIKSLNLAGKILVIADTTAEENKNLTLYRIDQLEKKVDKHNNLIDRMYKIENRVTLIEDEIKGVNVR